MVDISRWTSPVNMPLARKQRRAQRPSSFARKRLELPPDSRLLSTTVRKTERKTKMPNERVTIDAKTLHLLTSYSQSRLASGAGRETLLALGIKSREVVEAYRIGYLPSDFQSALPTKARRAFAGKNLAGAVVLPAFDETDTVVDLVAVQPTGTVLSLFDVPRGMLVPRIATAFTEIIVVDTFAAVLTCFSQGQSNVLMIRSVDDARQNALRLKRSGVKCARVQAQSHNDVIAAVLRDAGIEVQRAADVACLEFVSHDAKTELATFKAAEVIYTVEIGFDSESRMEVSLRKGEHLHRDRFDLAVDAQRKRFATSAALRTGVSFEHIEGHLLQLLDEARRLKAERINPLPNPSRKPEMNEQDRQQALQFLRQPDVLDRIKADLDELGWAGEDASKKLLYLAAISRKLPEPLWCALRASPGSGKSHGLDLIGELTPPEELIHVSRLTDSALYYQDAGGLRHKLLIIDEADALTPEVAVALRVLKTRGALSLSHAQRNLATGETRTHFIEAHGPVSVLTSTAGNLEAQLLSRCYEVPVDESPEQTARILAAQRRMRSSPALYSQHAEILHRHHALQRLLELHPVIIPFAERIQFPATHVMHRREHERFLALIEASALLHQHQRLRDGEFIVADIRDFEIAAGLAAPFLNAADQGLSMGSRELLAALTEHRRLNFTMDDLAALKPNWSRYSFRAALKELLTLEYVVSPRGGRGRLREYRLVAADMKATAPAGICLRAVGELVKVGFFDSANLSPKSAMA